MRYTVYIWPAFKEGVAGTPLRKLRYAARNNAMNAAAESWLNPLHGGAEITEDGVCILKFDQATEDA